VLLAALLAGPAAGQYLPVTPPEQRGRIDAERVGQHDAANIRTRFWNYGMVGDYPSDPGNVDLSVFHSAEVPKGSGMNYSDGITPFVLARVDQSDSTRVYIMETGFRERQGISPYTNRQMRFEPRPGFFQADPNINKGRSPAISNDPRTWPPSWPDKVDDPDDPGWSGAWNGYFGKAAAADQESYSVMDDQAYDAWPNYVPDFRDTTRRGLGLRVEVRGFQWANPQAGNVIFWHYDIVNEGTTDYDDNVIFGLYMDSGVGGSALSCDNVFESDDDNAFWDRSERLNLVYTWDKFGHGKDLSGNCGRTGYLGYAYLETPGNPFDGVDNDQDGILDERRDGGEGTRVVGQDAIRAAFVAAYDTAAFRQAYGALEVRPAYRAGVWFTGDEDMDWRPDVDDNGADGVPETGDTGELDGRPTPGEPNFDQTDLNESDQIGLTGFKQNRIRQGQGNPDPTIDDIIFFTNEKAWPERLWDHFTDPNPAARFDSALAANYNIAFLFASGPFKLKAGKRERFSLALAYGADLSDLRNTVKTVQLIYNANYRFAVPPALPTARAEAGDGYVRLSWDDIAERSIDPVTGEYDFEGYRIYRSTDPEFRDPKVITTGKGNPFPGNGKPIAQFDLEDGKRGYSRIAIEGVQYWLGEDTGLAHTWTDSTVVNGQEYYYAVCSYDFGFDAGVDSSAIYPSESPIAVSRTPRGGVILPVNVVSARPEPRVPGWRAAAADTLRRVAGNGTGTVAMEVVNSADVPDGHLFALSFLTPHPDSILATSYVLRDSTLGRTLYTTGRDFAAEGSGPVASGLLALVNGPQQVEIDTSRALTRWIESDSPDTTPVRAFYTSGRSQNLRRPGYPNDFKIVFDDVVVDSGLPVRPAILRPAKFNVYAVTDTGDTRLKFRFFDNDGDGTLSRSDEGIEVFTYSGPAPNALDVTWRIQPEPFSTSPVTAITRPRRGDVYYASVRRPFSGDDHYVFGTRGAGVDAALAKEEFAEKPYVVPNPYVASASFEPAPYAVSGRGDRRVEFRAIPQGATIRIYTVRGDLVRTLRQDGSTFGMVPWDLRTKDNLDVAPGLYIFHVDGADVGTHVGKLAIIK
jgi:hypothetical protein